VSQKDTHDTFFFIDKNTCVCICIYLYKIRAYIWERATCFRNVSQKTLTTVFASETRIHICTCVFAFVYIRIWQAHTYRKGLLWKSVSEDIEDTYVLRDKSTHVHVRVCIYIYLYRICTYIWKRAISGKRLRRHGRCLFLQRQEYKNARVCMHVYIFVYDGHIHMGKKSFRKASQKILMTLISSETRIHICVCVYAFVYICILSSHTYGEGLLLESVSEDIEDTCFSRDKDTCVCTVHVCVRENESERQIARGV